MLRESGVPTIERLMFADATLELTLSNGVRLRLCEDPQTELLEYEVEWPT